MLRRSCLIGVGHSLPSRVVENSEFEKWTETSDEWISSRSGIKRRHFADPDQTTLSVRCMVSRRKTVFQDKETKKEKKSSVRREFIGLISR